MARRTGFSIRLSKIIVNCCIKTILSELQQGHRISLKDFGAFHIVKSLGRTYFDIQKKEIKKSPAKNIVKFVPYKKIKKQLSTNVVDVHDENDGSIENIITLVPRVFINPAPTPKKLNPNNSRPLSGKQNIGKRGKHKQDVAEPNLAFEGKFLYDKFQGELDHDSFPSVKVPQHDTSILIPQRDKTGTTVGVMEPVLLSSIRKMCQELNNIIVLDNVKLPILNRNYSYRPDVCLYWKERNIYVDIEVDEPYDIVSRKPIHYKGNGDNLRDRYFIRNGWCVIRFAESQIHKNIEGVTNYIKRMLRWLTNDESIKYDEDTLESVERWTYEQAEQMASDNAREHYLNLSDYVSTDDTQTNHVSASYDIERLGFIKPDEDVLPPIEQSKWVSVIDKIAQINCDYCKVLKNVGYQWVYKNKQIKIVSHSCNEFKTGKRPLEYEREIPGDEIKAISPMENLGSQKHW
uniref:HU family DNA-binding protein n=1 Tax=Prevotella sp. TaxID=59823 RepID=UPI003FEE47B1